MEYLGYTYSKPNPMMGNCRDEQYTDLIDLLEDVKPNRICEVGGGISTEIFEQYCAKYNKTMYTIDNHQRFKRENTTVLTVVEETSITINGKTYDNCNIYTGLEEWLEDKEPFDLLFIDGPAGYGQYRLSQPYGIVQIMSFLAAGKIADNCIVLVHDSERNNIRATLVDFEAYLTDHGYTFTMTRDRPDHSIVNSNNRQMTKYVITKQS